MKCSKKSALIKALLLTCLLSNLGTLAQAQSNKSKSVPKAIAALFKTATQALGSGPTSGKIEKEGGGGHSGDGSGGSNANKAANPGKVEAAYSEDKIIKKTRSCLANLVEKFSHQFISNDPGIYGGPWYVPEADNGYFGVYIDETQDGYKVRFETHFFVAANDGSTSGYTTITQSAMPFLLMDHQGEGGMDISIEVDRSLVMSKRYASNGKRLFFNTSNEVVIPAFYFRRDASDVDDYDGRGVKISGSKITGLHVEPKTVDEEAILFIADSEGNPVKKTDFTLDLKSYHACLKTIFNN